MSQLDDHAKGIRGWLDKQGYPLEMSIARILFSSGIGTIQGSNYEDPDTNQAREIDILSKSFAYSANNTLLLQAIIECKYSEHPIVAFTYPNIRKSLAQFWVPCNNLGRMVLNGLIKDDLINQLPVFSERDTIAYAIKQTMVSKDIAFEAIMSVVKASYYLSNLYNRDMITLPSQDNLRKNRAVYIGIPTIVVRAPLYICYLDNNNEIALEPRSSVLLEWSYPKVGTMIIKIIQEKEVVNFANELMQSATILHNQFTGYF